MTNRMQFIIIGNGISFPGTMGGNTKILIEFIKRWHKDIENIEIITSPKGYLTCKNYCINNFSNVYYHILKRSPILTRFGELFYYIPYIVETLSIVNGIKERLDNAILYSSSNCPTDLVPAIFIKIFHPKSKWIASFYLFIPNPLKGYECAYQEKAALAVPSIKNTILYILDYLTLPFVVKYSDIIFVTNDMDKPLLEKRGFDSEKILAIYGGVSLEDISKIALNEIIYDGCFVGRIHPQKGVTYLIQIWDYVRKAKPNARLAIIGNGPKDYEKKVKQEIVERNLQNNIVLCGYKDGRDKYKILKSSKIFLHSTIFDNSGMAAAEAMACGLPVVMFDIPALRVAYPKGAVKVPHKDCFTFAEKVLELLDDKELYNKLRYDAMDLAKEWDWEKRAKNALNFIERELNDIVPQENI